jgi:hypothetical protein
MLNRGNGYLTAAISIAWGRLASQQASCPGQPIEPSQAATPLACFRPAAGSAADSRTPAIRPREDCEMTQALITIFWDDMSRSTLPSRALLQGCSSTLLKSPGLNGEQGMIESR